MAKKSKKFIFFFLTVLLLFIISPSSASFSQNDPSNIKIFPSLSKTSVKNGEELKILVLAKSPDGIKSIEAEIEDVDKINLHLTSGDQFIGTWEANWTAHDLTAKTYKVILTVTDNLGNWLKDSSLSFTDPVFGIDSRGTNTYYPFNASNIEGSLELDTGENYLASAVIDTNNGYAYFGTNTSPGKVIKVDLSNFIRVGSVTLNAGEDYLVSAVIDTNNGYAYFGTNTAPGQIIKIDLNNFARVGSITLNAGENNLSSAVIDTTNSYAYFGTNSAPGKVIKVDLSNFIRVGSVTLNAGEDYLASAVIDTNNGYAYFGTNTAPGKVIKVDLSNFTRVGSIALNAGEDYLQSAVIDTANGCAYFGTTDLSFNAAEIVKIDLNNFQRIESIAPSSNFWEFTSAVIDTNAGYAYFGHTNNPGGGKIVKIDLTNFQYISSINLPNEEDFLYSAVIDPANEKAYFGSKTLPGKIVKIDLALFQKENTLTLSSGENYLTSAVIDTNNGYAYFGTNTSPGQIIKVDLNSFTRVDSIILNPGEDYLTSAVIDTNAGYAYFGTYTDIGKIIKIRLTPFERVDAVRFHPTFDLGYLSCAVIHPSQGYAYFAAEENPGRISKLDLNNFTITQTIYSYDARFIVSAVIDVNNNYMYVGTRGTSSKVGKVNLDPNNFDFIDDINLESTTGWDLFSAVIDTNNGYAYFGTFTGSAIKKIYKVDIDPARTFQKIGTIEITTSARLISAVIDTSGGYAYFGTDTTPGQIIKVDLNNFTIADTLTLNTGENDLRSAVIDQNNNYAYFGTNTTPGKVVKIFTSTEYVNPGIIRATKAELNDTAYPLAVHFYSHVADGSKARLAIYEGSPSPNLQWQSNEIELNNTGWQQINISQGTPSNIILNPSNNYWLAWQTDRATNSPGYITGGWVRQTSAPTLPLGSAGEFDSVRMQHPEVIYDGNEYKMWYTGHDGSKNRIGYATSTDGINWTKHGMVLDVGPNAWESKGAYSPSVLYDSNAGKYKMWYTGYDGSKNRIGYATSTDGINWTKHGNYVLCYNGDNSASPSVIYDSNTGEYRAWYQTFTDRWAIVYAHSSDGISWTTESAAALPTIPDSYEHHLMDPFVIYDSASGEYKMWYAGFNKNKSRAKIFYATSSSGNNGTWTKDINNPVLDINPGEWDGYRVAAPTVVYDSNTNSYKMWYQGFGPTVSDWRIAGYAIMNNANGTGLTIPYPNFSPYPSNISYPQITLTDDQWAMYVEYDTSPPNNPPQISNLGPQDYINGSETDSTTPTLHFDISDPNNSHIQYQIQIAKDSPDWSNNLVVDYVSGNYGNYSGQADFSVGQPLNNGNYIVGWEGQELDKNADYYWRAKVIEYPAPPNNPPYLESDWAYGCDTGGGNNCVQRSFRVIETAGPGLPELQYVGSLDLTTADGSNPVAINETNPTFNFQYTNPDYQSTDLSFIFILSKSFIDFDQPDPTDWVVFYNEILSGESGNIDFTVGQSGNYDPMGMGDIGCEGQTLGLSEPCAGQNLNQQDPGNYYWLAFVEPVGGGNSASIAGFDTNDPSASPSFIFDSVNGQPPAPPPSYITYLGSSDGNLTQNITINNSQPDFNFELNNIGGENTLSLAILISKDTPPDINDPANNAITYIGESYSNFPAHPSFTVGQPAGAGIYMKGGEGQQLEEGNYYWAALPVTDGQPMLNYVFYGYSDPNPSFVYSAGPPNNNPIISDITTSTDYMDGRNVHSIDHIFTFQISDPDGDNVGYQIQIMDGALNNIIDYISPTTFVSNSYISYNIGQPEEGGTYNTGGEGQVLSVDNAAGTEYWWRIKAIDEKGGESPWVQIWNNNDLHFYLQETTLFSIEGIMPQTQISNETTNIPTSSNAIDFGQILPYEMKTGAVKLTGSANYNNGYQILISQDHDLLSSQGYTIESFPATNDNPQEWIPPDPQITKGYFGYSTTNNNLSGSPDRFYNNGIRRFAGLTAVPTEVAKIDQPILNAQDYLIFKLEVNERQESGTYSNTITVSIVGNY